MFQTTGGAQNVGLFDNVEDTRRAGIEFSLSQRRSRLHWFVEYSFIEATFEDSFVVNGPNHPLFEDDPVASQIVGENMLQVSSGSSIPGIPEHQANVGFEFAFNDRLRLGADVVARSGVYLRGDEINVPDKTDPYAILNLRGEYRVGTQVTLFARIENALDQDYETLDCWVSRMKTSRISRIHASLESARRLAPGSVSRSHYSQRISEADITT